MTVERNTISCDAYGCKTKAALDGRAVISAENLRLRYAMLGWTTSGIGDKLDICPNHG
jgi:hypothetical protein